MTESEPTNARGFLIDFDEIARVGEISKEETRVAKWHGICGQRQPRTFFVRVVLPGGILLSSQARALATIADRHARGVVSLTTRQAVQLHGVELEALPKIQRELLGSGLSPFHGCGDVTRNVTACPLADNCPHRVFGVLGDVKRTARALTAQPDLDDLPRKFKISFNGCSGNCALPYVNDVGVTAVRTTREGIPQQGYAIVVGGGHGRQPLVAQPLFGFVPRSKIVAACRGVALLFKQHGDRTNRAKARLKYVVKRLGIDRCRDIVERHLEREGVDCSEIFAHATVETKQPPPGFLAEDSIVGTGNLAVQRIRIPNGELRSDQLWRLADHAESYGDTYLRANPRQNIEIHGVRRESISALRAEIDELGLGATGCFGLSDVVTCVGSTYCPFAATRTQGLAAALGFLDGPDFDDIRTRVMINISGCSNACALSRVADIGLCGARMNDPQGSTEGYEVFIGGHQQRYGTSIGKYRTQDCTRLVRALLETFRRLMLSQESFSDTVNRTGFAAFKDGILAHGIQGDLVRPPRAAPAPAT